MKKFLLVLAVAGFAVACNNSGDSKTTTDSPAVKIDTPAAAPVTPAPDSTHKTDSATTAKPDSTKK